MWRCAVLLCIDFVPFCEHRNAIVREIPNHVLCDQKQVGFLDRRGCTLEYRCENAVPYGDCQLLLLDAFPLLGSFALQLLG